MSMLRSASVTFVLGIGRTRTAGRGRKPPAAHLFSRACRSRFFCCLWSSLLGAPAGFGIVFAGMAGRGSWKVTEAKMETRITEVGTACRRRLCEACRMGCRRRRHCCALPACVCILCLVVRVSPSLPSYAVALRLCRASSRPSAANSILHL